jgi:GTP cyclohydrolase I
MMQGDVLATVCGLKVHRHKGDAAEHSICPRWCDAGYRTQSTKGSPHPPPTVARGSTTVPWDHINVTGDLAMIHPPVEMIQARSGDGTVIDRFPSVLDVAAEHDRRGSGVFDADAIRARNAKELSTGAAYGIAEEGVRALLVLMGEDPTRAGLRDTPKRVVKAYLEMADRPGAVADLLSRQFEDGPKDGEMVTVRDVEFVSICEHHLLPFTGRATIAYIPAGARVVGLSKLPRLLHHYARRPQVQERLTGQITAALDDHLDTNGSACHIEATHSCMSLRGVRAQGAAMVTTSLTGRFLENDATRNEFLMEARRG